MSARLLRARCGTTALEFAIVLPILILLTFNVFDSGRAFFVKHGLEYAVSTVSREAPPAMASISRLQIVSPARFSRMARVQRGAPA